MAWSRYPIQSFAPNAGTKGFPLQMRSIHRTHIVKLKQGEVIGAIFERACLLRKSQKKLKVYICARFKKRNFHENTS